MPLSPAAHAFTVRLASQTGLNPRVIAGWVMAETSGHDTTNGPNNWLNVGSFDSGFQGGGANVWQNPLSAADATAAFLKGAPVNGIRPPLGGGAPSVRSILSTVGKGIPTQVQAIQNSGWASSHYNGALMNDVRPFLGANFGAPVVPSPGTRVPGAQPKIGAVRVPFQTTSTKLDPASIAGSFLANENAINPWNIPVPGASKISTGSNSLLSTGVLPTTLQTTTSTKTSRVVLKAHNALQSLAGGTPLKVAPGTTPGFKGYVNPIQGATIGRTDMGVDLNLPVGHPIRAIGDSRVVNIYPNWYQGQPYVLLQLLNGPQKGKYYYVAEQIAPRVRPGQVLHAGDTIGTYASSGTGIEMGWGTPSESTLAQATTGYSEGQVTPAGSSFRNFLGSLGAK